MEGWRPENPEEAVLSTCSTLITVIGDEGSRIIQFSHFSVKEFLISDRLQASEVGGIRDYHISLDAAHTLLVRACLAVLLRLDEDMDKELLETFPLVSYAAWNWVEHAKYEDVAPRVQGAVEDTFDPRKPHLATWISIYDVAQDLDMRIHIALPEVTQYHQSPPETAALVYAAFCGLSRVVNYLITTHAGDVNAHHHNRGAPLHVASRHGHAEVVSLLLQHNADVNLRYTTFGDWTPLHFASALGHANVVQLLLEHGADINTQNIYHATPLSFASQSGHLEVVRLLLRNGADVIVRNKGAVSPFQLAKRGRHVEIAQLLLKHGAEKE